MGTGTTRHIIGAIEQIRDASGTNRDLNVKYVDGQVPNLENGSATGSAQMKQDGTSGTFSFTGKNTNATALDPTLTGDIQYGAVGAFSASFGGKSSAQGKRSMAVGTTTIAKGAYSFASGDNSVALGNDSHAEGSSTVTGPNAYAAHSEGHNTQALGHSSHSEGNNTIAKGDQSHAEGVRTAASGGMSHAEGVDTNANADNSHAEGNSTATKTALPTSGGSGSSGGSSGGSTDNPDDASWNIDEHRGVSSHAEGVGSTTYGYASHAEGFNSVAYGHLSHAEGEKTTTGTSTGVGGRAAHAEGHSTVASGDYSHAEGQGTAASGEFSHAGGLNSSASGACSFVHGNNCHDKKKSYCSVFGKDNVADADCQFIVGNHAVNSSTTSNAYFIVGNNKKTNAFEVWKDGSAHIQGSLNVGAATTVGSDGSISIDSGDNTLTYAPATGTLTASTFSGALDGNASSSSKLDHSVTFKVTGDVTGSATASNLSGTEVSITTEIAAGKVGATELATNAVTSDKLGSIIATTGDSATANGMTVELTQSDSKGGLSINLSGDSVSKATNATNATNVSVTVATSTSKLYLLGATNTSGNQACYAYSTVYATGGAMYANSYNASSDRRLKENISDYSCEKSILDLPVKKFDFINGPKNQIGCIAQDLQEICPEIVHENSDGYLSIQESKIVYLLLDEVKRLRKEVDELKGGK